VDNSDSITTRLFVPLQYRLHLPALRTGLLGRLVLAFGLVVVFVWIANRAATNGGTIVRVSEPPAAVVVAAPPPFVAVMQAPRPIEPSPPATDRVASLAHIAAFLSAFGTFEHAVERRVVEGERFAGPMNRAVAVLREQAALIEQGFSVIEPAREPAVRAAAGARRHMEGARALIAQADARRQASASYWQAVDVLDSELKSALDNTWKILGRVIARESLLAMNRRADEIRRLSSRLLLDGSLDAQGHADLARAQSELAAQLDELVKRNGGSKNGAWMTRAREALQTAIAARVELARIEAVTRTARETMDRSHASLDKAVRGLAETIEKLGENSRTMPLVDRAEEGIRDPVPAPPASGPMRVTSDGTSLVTRTYDSPTSDPRVSWLRWASGAILLTLLAVCFWIVRSVVHPVREFASTIARLSKGELSARFKPAGIRELDTLATAFNQMAEELSRAQLKSREYQTELEERVDERTRQLRHLADHDELTALPNRRQLTWYLDLTLARAARSQSRVGVFFLDLDNFKTINDSMGHAYGDLVLQAIAQRLRNAIPSNAFAARLGGDEFTMIHEAATVEELLEVGEALAVAFEKPHLIQDRELVVGVSLGASIFPDHESEAAALLRAADAALFSAKSAGRSRLAVFEPALLEAASLKFRIEQGLRRAVERGEFELLFQPEVSLGRLDTVLVEALLRWRRPDGQYVSPGEFLAVAEESGLIMTISDWVMRASIEQAAVWYHGAWPQVRVAINVSARQLLDPRFDERVTQLLEQYHVPASCIEIELTETVLQTGQATIAMLRRLRTIGISIALDDFGTGYSTLASIEQLPLTRVKMDRSLIAEIDRRSRSLAIARAIIALCRDLGLAVTAEGVERAEQLALLAEEPGLNLQGYLIDAPLPADVVADSVATMPARLQSLLLTMPPSRTLEAQPAQPSSAKAAAG
jgi:diguanylate cyclase (GGDEF)-like protein